MRLSGKHVLISATANGIGRACVDAVLHEGGHVYATDIVPIETQGVSVDRLRTAMVEATDAGAVERFV